ncbi:MAG: lysophospholipid acyltransferase family protein [Candidatus Acidiferrales bacterium]
MIRTVLFVAFLACAIFLVLPFFILHAWLTGSPEVMYSMAMSALRAGLKIAGVRVRVEGAENIPPRTCVFVSNHISNLDPPALVPYIPRRVALLAKKEVFRIPVLATGMRLCQIVPVDRQDREAAAASIDKAVEFLRGGTSFLVYAEGTRSRDGHLKPFKNGTFVMAIEAGVAVVPISLIGPQKLMRKGEWFIRPGEVVVRFGPFVDAAQYKPSEREALRDRVHALVAQGLPEDQRPLPG